MKYQSQNPRTEEVFARFEVHSIAEATSLVTALHAQSSTWSLESVARRVEFCRKAQQLLDQNAEQLAQLASREMGKNLLESRAEVQKCAALCAYVASTLHTALQPRRVDLAGAHATVRYLPLGCILGIMPWNFPYWQAIRFLIPALAAGNICVLKHAPNVQQCAEAIVDLLNEAAGENLVCNLRLSNAGVANLISASTIQAVSLTGSTRAGKAVAEAAGKALKPSLLELGGSDGYLILEHADLDLAIEACTTARVANSGQSCISPKRLIIHHKHYQYVLEQIIAFAKTQNFVSKDIQADRAGQLAPLARADLRDALHQQITSSLAEGARLTVGGTVPSGKGYYYPATVLAEVAPGMPAFDEELFGPVFCLTSAKDEEDAIRLANQSLYGLGAAVFSRDVVRAEQLAAQRLQAGSCFVNAFVRSDPKLPFGGIKQSGYGRELSLEGVRAFTNVKTVYVAT